MVLEKLSALIAEQFGVDASEITEETSFVGGSGRGFAGSGGIDHERGRGPSIWARWRMAPWRM